MVAGATETVGWAWFRSFSPHDQWSFGMALCVYQGGKGIRGEGRKLKERGSSRAACLELISVPVRVVFGSVILVMGTIIIWVNMSYVLNTGKCIYTPPSVLGK